MTRVHVRRPLFGTTAATATIKKWIRASSCPNSGSKGGAVVRALVSHQCDPGSTPDVDSAIFGLSLLLVLSLAPRGFSSGSPVFPSPQKLTLPNSHSIWNARTRFSEFIWTPMCLGGKQAIYNFCFTIFSPLFHLVYFVKCSRARVPSSTKREFRHFHVVSCNDG